MNKIYECRDVRVCTKLVKMGYMPFNCKYDNDGVVWLFEYQPLMKAITEE